MSPSCTTAQLKIKKVYDHKQPIQEPSGIFAPPDGELLGIFPFGFWFIMVSVTFLHYCPAENQTKCLITSNIVMHHSGALLLVSHSLTHLGTMLRLIWCVWCGLGVKVAWILKPCTIGLSLTIESQPHSWSGYLIPGYWACNAGIGMDLACNFRDSNSLLKVTFF